MANQTPIQEMAERVGEEAPGLLAAITAVALQDHRRMLADSARRVRDSHKMLARQAGMEDCLTAGPEINDDVGDISISGDHTHYHAAAAKPDVTPTSAPSVPQIAAGIGKAALLATALGTGGLGAGVGALVSNWLASGQPPVPSPVENGDTTLDVRLLPNE